MNILESLSPLLLYCSLTNLKDLETWTEFKAKKLWRWKCIRFAIQSLEDLFIFRICDYLAIKNEKSTKNALQTDVNSNQNIIHWIHKLSMRQKWFILPVWNGIRISNQKRKTQLIPMAYNIFLSSLKSGKRDIKKFHEFRLKLLMVITIIFHCLIWCEGWLWNMQGLLKCIMKRDREENQPRCNRCTFNN